jgi:predicted nucleic acid-binding protein
MAILLDTDVAIHLRDGEPSIWKRLNDRSERPVLSILAQVELEGGVLRDRIDAGRKRLALDLLLRRMMILPFDEACVAVYRVIIEARGYNRPRLVDRMIAATAMAHDLTLVTMNGDDFRDIPDLRLEVWPNPQ